MPPLEVKTTILAGGRIEIDVPELPEGTEATVRITVDDASSRRSLSEILKDYPGGRMFKTAEEVDRYIREDRDSWGD